MVKKIKSEKKFLHLTKVLATPKQSCHKVVKKMKYSEIGSLTQSTQVATLVTHIPGLPDYSCQMLPKPEKMYQMKSKCTK
jgi:hypothetical protein